MKTRQEKQKVTELGHNGMANLIKSIDPKGKYFTDFIVNNDGSRTYHTGVVDGALLTEAQMLTAELIK